MSHYLIRRHMPGYDDVDLEAAGFRSVVCQKQFPGLTWIRSYWDPAKEESLCLYEADREEDVRDHAKMADIPCDEVREVVEMSPAAFLAGVG